MAEHSFTNKYGKHKRWCNDTFKMSKPQYSQIILTQIQSPLSTQKLGLNTKFRVAPNTKISFFFSAQTHPYQQFHSQKKWPQFKLAERGCLAVQDNAIFFLG